MADLSRLTKAEILKLLEQKDEELEELKAKEEARSKQIELDMSFGAGMSEEKKAQLKAQREKDFIKRMTHGKWTSQQKYQEYLDEQQGKVRPV